MASTNDEALLRDIHHYLISQAQSGDKMETETELAARFQVSRYRVRLVLDKLSQMGVITRAQKRGMTLNVVSPKKLADNFCTQFEVANFDLREFLEARIALSNEVAPLAVMRVTPSVIGQLQGILSRFEGAIEVRKAALDFHFQFEECLFAASGNRVLEVFARSLSALWRGLIDASGEVGADFLERALDADREALKALKVGDAKHLSETLSEGLREEMLHLIEH